jgi:hypothetical protein
MNLHPGPPGREQKCLSGLPNILTRTHHAGEKDLNVQHRTPNVEQGIVSMNNLAEHSESNLRRSMFKRLIQDRAKASIAPKLRAMTLNITPSLLDNPSTAG